MTAATDRPLVERLWKQAGDFVEIVRLKLRIIGFSNKQDGLYGLLGEALYRKIASGELTCDESPLSGLVEDIRTCAVEIHAAEEAIEAIRSGRAADGYVPGPDDEAGA